MIWKTMMLCLSKREKIKEIGNSIFSDALKINKDIPFDKMMKLFTRLILLASSKLRKGIVEYALNIERI